MKTIEKQKDHAFGKDVYLLGTKDGEKIWLEAPQWDCGWYWGFGYIETYTGKKPSTSRDIASHSHWENGIVGRQEKYDCDKKCFVKADYVHHLNENPSVTESVLEDKESWLLAEYMQTFYTLSKTAGLYHRGGSHLTSCDKERKLMKDSGLAEMINKQQLPALFKLIIALLEPKN
jgi:hypothetical protein